MVKINFYLDKPNSVKQTCIMVSCHASKRIKVSTGISIDPEHWNRNKQEVKDITATNRFRKKTNKKLRKIKSRIEKAYLKISLKNRLITRDDILAALKPKEKIDFIPIYESYIESLVNTKKKNTIKKHTTTFNSIKNFQNRTGFEISFDKIGKDFFDAYIDYFVNHADNIKHDPHIINPPDSKMGLTNNTIDSYLTRLKIFMNYANDHKLTNNTYHKKLKLTIDEVEIISLTFEELESLENLKLPEGGKLDNARSLFLLECYTSLRYSDIKNLKPDHLKDDAIFLDVTTIKTNDRLRIPISPPAKKLIQELKAGKIRSVSNQKLNTYLKELCKLAEIDEPCLITRHSGAKRIEMMYHKWELISSHVGRKTFVTLHYLAGVPVEILMAITGHKDYRNFKRYLKIGEKDKVKAINDVWAKYKPELL